MVSPPARWGADVGLTKARLLHPACLEHDVSKVVSDQPNCSGGTAGSVRQRLHCLGISLVCSNGDWKAIKGRQNIASPCNRAGKSRTSKQDLNPNEAE